MSAGFKSWAKEQKTIEAHKVHKLHLGLQFFQLILSPSFLPKPLELSTLLPWMATLTVIPKRRFLTVMSEPGREHWAAAKWVLRYLTGATGTPEYHF